MQRALERAPQDPSDAVRERLRVLFSAGQGRARAVGRPVLVSTTERVSPIVALDVLDPQSTSQMYWAAPRDGCALAGIGAALTLGGAGERRFVGIGRAWQELLDDAVLQDAEPSGAGGPILMGGFSFDPDGPHAGGWRGFDAAGFTIPRLMVASRSTECWLTLNALVHEDESEAAIDELVALRDRALAARGTGFQPPAPLAPDRPVMSGARPMEPHGVRLAEIEAARWRETVRDATRAIAAGRLEKVVLAREVRVSLPPDFDVIASLRHLEAEHPNTFVYAAWRDGATFFGASPERLVRLHDRELTTSVLAGSTPRGTTPAQDAALAAELQASRKDREEHDIVRRELSAALATVCTEVVADAEPTLVSLPNVHHLHTAVRARLAAERSVFDVLERLHPTPAVGGAPRDAALAFIREREEIDRGWYAAPIGWVGASAAEFAVALRCALVRREPAEASLFAGCGIVAGSDPAAEYDESQVKLEAAREALAAGIGATSLETRR